MLTFDVKTSAPSASQLVDSRLQKLEENIKVQAKALVNLHERLEEMEKRLAGPSEQVAQHLAAGGEAVDAM